MRGQVVPRSGFSALPGITPADAGTSLFLWGQSIKAVDHPRGCGDKVHDGNSNVATLGSPPRMRGQVRMPNRLVRKIRITPADAGTSRCRIPGSAGRWDHPRGCGDKHVYTSCNRSITGSPPRMRGQEMRQLDLRELDRITPADAGTRLAGYALRHPGRDHPRGCGDKTGQESLFQPCLGSPPRMRGQAAAKCLCIRSSGITPADAGTSFAENGIPDPL